MDQAISLLAQHGTAKLIEFNPLTTFDVNLPAGYARERETKKKREKYHDQQCDYCLLIMLYRAAFVICNSLVESTKYLTAGTNYNMRYLLISSFYLFISLPFFFFYFFFVLSYLCIPTYAVKFRVLECRLATAILAKSMGLPWQTIKKPKELQQASKKSLFELQQAANEVLKEDYSKEDVAKILGMEVRLPASLFSLSFLLYSPSFVFSHSL